MGLSSDSFAFLRRYWAGPSGSMRKDTTDITFGRFDFRVPFEAIINPAQVGGHLAHKTILSIFAWFIFVLLILGRKVYGWRGSNAANITLIGFFFLFLSYFGTKLVLETII